PYDDAEEVELDECNGHTSEEYGYHYHAAPLEQNATLTCLMGLTAEGQDAGGGRAGPPEGDGERPAPPEEG
ncbi:MAG: YHYH protein, partial [Acidimicrobiales bacterium]